jgi:hypothetical protein
MQHPASLKPPEVGTLKVNITTRAIASADGWVARFGDHPVPLVCWALTDDGLVGLIQGAGGDARNAERESIDGRSFTDYRHVRQGA